MRKSLRQPVRKSLRQPVRESLRQPVRESLRQSLRKLDKTSRYCTDRNTLIVDQTRCFCCEANGRESDRPGGVLPENDSPSAKRSGCVRSRCIPSNVIVCR